MKMVFGERTIESKVFRYPLRWGRYPKMWWFVGFRIDIWEIIPDQERLDEIAAARQAVENQPNIPMRRLELANSLRMAALREEALAEYKTLAASGDLYLSQLAQRLIDDEARGTNDWLTEPAVVSRMARWFLFAPFARQGRA